MFLSRRPFAKTFFPGQGFSLPQKGSPGGFPGCVGAWNWLLTHNRNSLESIHAKIICIQCKVSRKGAKYKYLSRTYIIVKQILRKNYLLDSEMGLYKLFRLIKKLYVCVFFCESKKDVAFPSELQSLFGNFLTNKKLLRFEPYISVLLDETSWQKGVSQFRINRSLTCTILRFVLLNGSLKTQWRHTVLYNWLMHAFLCFNCLIFSKSCLDLVV